MVRFVAVHSLSRCSPRISPIRLRFCRKWALFATLHSLHRRLAHFYRRAESREVVPRCEAIPRQGRQKSTPIIVTDLEHLLTACAYADRTRHRQFRLRLRHHSRTRCLASCAQRGGDRAPGKSASHLSSSPFSPRPRHPMGCAGRAGVLERGRRVPSHPEDHRPRDRVRGRSIRQRCRLHVSSVWVTLVRWLLDLLTCSLPQHLCDWILLLFPLPLAGTRSLFFPSTHVRPTTA